MKIAWQIIFAVAIVGAAFWLWTTLFPSPEKIIMRQLNKVARDASFSENENPLIIANRAETLADFFSTNVEVNIDVPEREQHSFIGQSEITQAAAGAHMELKSLSVEILDASVSVAADKKSATATATVKAKSSRDADEIIQPMKFSFQKIGRDWLITRVETVRTFS